MLITAAVENTLFHFDKPFSYSVPSQLENVVLPGVRVLVPFGRGDKNRVALVLSVENIHNEESAKLKHITKILDKRPIISAEMLELVSWIKERYFCTLFEAAKLMIPSGLGYRIKNSYILSDNVNAENFCGVQKQIVSLLYSAVKSVAFEFIEKQLGITENCPDFISLLENGTVLKINKATAKVQDAFAKMLRAVPDFDEKLTTKQAEAYKALCEVGTVSEKEFSYFTGVSSAVIKKLCEKGAAEAFECEVYRKPEILDIKEHKDDFVLSEEQQSVFENLKKDFDTKKTSCALLHGVTGSGKTSVFMKLMQHAHNCDRGIIVMVPEISLTAQTIRQFAAVFGDTVAVFHSKLSLGERLDEWKRVKRGDAKIVVGTRSAVFAPVNNLGLIVIDEEQEHTYKSESSPRYDAREVAMKRCAENSALCLMSSATPSVEAYHAAKSGKFPLYKLEKRFGQAELPDVSLIDLNNEHMQGADMLISPTLRTCLKENYDAGKQSIILLNRRGYHTFIGCKDCGEVASCPHCSISLTFHEANGRLMCHYCGYSTKFNDLCTSCGSSYIQFKGAGTQRAVQELAEFMPQAKTLRIDTDSTSGKYSLEKMLSAFGKGDYDIMIGTQMVAKGLDFENVTLVGVISADLMLFSDDFRSNERTFDLLTQVVGRAGRRTAKGEALIQTYYPENEFLSLAAMQNYEGFFETEIAFRKAMMYPPFVDICVVGFVSTSEKKVCFSANGFMHELRATAKEEYKELPMRVLQPAPAAVAKISGKYRYKIIIKCRNNAKFRQMISSLLNKFALDKRNQGVSVYAAVNPYNIL